MATKVNRFDKNRVFPTLKVLLRSIGLLPSRGQNLKEDMKIAMVKMFLHIVMFPIMVAVFIVHTTIIMFRWDA